MLRGENVICGTISTGTAVNLALAVCPHPPGGADFFATFGGMGLGTTQATILPYTIIEYTDSTFATALGMEKGWGALTLGSGIGTSLLNRLMPQMTGTSLNGTPSISYGSANVALTRYSIGTAANCLVFIGASASDLPAFGCPLLLPSTVTNYDNKGAGPFGPLQLSTTGNNPLVYGSDCYFLILWATPLLVKKFFTYLATADTGSTTNNLYARLYAVGTDGRPGKLLYDFGLVGTSNASLKTVGVISSGLGSQGIWLLPGEYYLDLAPFQTGTPTANTPKMGSVSTPILSGRTGTLANFLLSAHTFTAGSATSGAAPDPANVTSFAGTGSLSMPCFSLKDAA